MTFATTFRLAALGALLGLLGWAGLAPASAASPVSVEVPDALGFGTVTVVPLAPMLELLGAETTSADGALTITRQGKGFTCTVGKTAATSNGKAITLPLAPFTRESVTYVPLRELAEGLGGTFALDAEEVAAKTATVTAPNLPAPLILPFVLRVDVDEDGMEIPLPLSDFRDYWPQLYVMDADGTGLRRLSYAAFGCSLPTFSADGSRCAYLHSLGGTPIGSVYARPTASGQSTCVSEADLENGIVYMEPAISPDGATVWSTRMVMDGEQADAAVWRVPFGGGEGERLILGMFSCFTADGKSYVYLGGDIKQGKYSVVVRDLATPQKRSLNLGQLDGKTERAIVSPDARVMFRYRKYGEEEDAPKFIITCPLGENQGSPKWCEPGEDARTLAEADGTFTPDGARIIFSRLDGQTSKGIFVMNTDRSNCTQLTDGDDRSPVCSMDGKFIYFSRNGRICRMTMEGGDVEVLTKELNLQGLTCGPDGRVYFLARPQELFG